MTRIQQQPVVKNGSRRPPKVSVVIPAFNEGAYVKNLVSAIRGVPGIYEIILVDDGSVPRLANQYDQIPGIRVIHKRRNRGKDKAVLTGFQASKGDYVLVLDADLQGLKRHHLMQVLRMAPAYQIVNMAVGTDFLLPKVAGTTYVMVGSHLMARDFIFRFQKRLFSHDWNFEFELNEIIRQHPEIQFMICELEGVGHLLKGEKYGFFAGILLDIKMLWQIIFVKYRFFGFIETRLALTERIRRRQIISA